MTGKIGDQHQLGVARTPLSLQVAPGLHEGIGSFGACKRCGYVEGAPG